MLVCGRSHKSKDEMHHTKDMRVKFSMMMEEKQDTITEIVKHNNTHRYNYVLVGSLFLYYLSFSLNFIHSLLLFLSFCIFPCSVYVSLSFQPITPGQDFLLAS